MQVITEEFMEFSSEVARRLENRMKENDNKPTKIEKITKYPDTKVPKNSAKHNFLETLEKKTFPTPANLLLQSDADASHKDSDDIQVEEKKMQHAEETSIDENKVQDEDESYEAKSAKVEGNGSTCIWKKVKRLISVIKACGM
nr:hypothetical protein [Tanacetum cinerariifolium]